MTKILSFLIMVFLARSIAAQSEPSTYFNIYVPPNNEAVQRNVALIVTAINDSTHFTITDDPMDGDSDDSVSGMLMAGQSYILYMKDNGINDDALYASGGVLARNGDYYIINSSNLVYASMSTDSDWQHDFVPSINKKTVGQKFYVYAPKVSSSPRDLNVFAYHPNTTVSIFKISTVPTTQTGYTNINMETKQLVAQRTLNPGEDIIHLYSEGRDIMQTGGTYMIETNKDVSVQYGALHGNPRDGGAYVPSSNGSGSGELFYFAVPYQAVGEQEIRIVSWDNQNQVQLSRYHNGTWIDMKSWTLGQFKPADWVGKQNGNVSFPTVFRVTCTPGKRVSVMEANWMETGSTNTSDMATMISSESGSSAGKKFLAYMLPPSNQNNVVNPFTGQLFSGQFSHFYLFAGSQTTTVTIKDAKTNGQVLTKTYQIEAGRYTDAFFNIAEWKSIYNGSGLPNGPDRPYVLIESEEYISVLSTNFNDNWMTYFGSSLPQSFNQTGSISNPTADPGEIINHVANIVVPENSTLEEVSVQVNIASGLIPISSGLYNQGVLVQDGQITSQSNGSQVVFDTIPTITNSDEYTVQTSLIVSPTYNNGVFIPNGVVLTIESQVSAFVDGEFQQSIDVQGVQNNSANTSSLLYSACQIATISAAANNAWNTSWVDYNGDGHEDLFVATKDATQKNELYKNNGNGTFTKINNHPLVNVMANTASAVWADINNNGRMDVFLVNATQHASQLYINQGNGQFTLATNSGIDPHPQYFHGAAFADFDNDGFVDLIITNFFETRFHQLYKNNGNNTFTAINNTPIGLESERSMAPILADYNNDGLVDVFIPNGNNRPNSLFKNLGNFQFEKVIDPAINNEAKNSVGAAWGDFNGDGFVDLLVVNSSGQNNDLFQNLGNGTFQKMNSSIISNDGGESHGAAWFDANNDGFLDAYFTNDNAPSALYINSGNGNFEKNQIELIAGNLGSSFGLAVGDYDKNGQLDLAIATHTNGSTRFFCHNGTSANWIGFQLQSSYSNRSGLGARIEVKSNGKWQHRQHMPVSGFGGQNSQLIHFGLGENNLVDSVRVFWPSGAIQMVANFNLNQYNPILEEASKKITGTTFHDLNGNGIKEANEPVLGNIHLKINNGQSNLASNNNGNFEFRTNNNAVLFAVNSTNWSLSSAHASHNIPNGVSTFNVMLPLQAVSQGHDLAINMSTTAWRRGFTNESVIQVKNLGTTTAQNPVVQLTFPTGSYLKNSNMAYTSNEPSTFYWSLNALNPGQSISIQLIDSVGLEVNTGDILNVLTCVNDEGLDLDLNNNCAALDVEVVGAIDPNDMLVNPLGAGREGFIEKSQPLTYTIRFENIGTYQATYVFLENQIPTHLDLTTFEILGSSHDFNYTLSTDGFLQVNYLHINLPTSEQDSIGAHGFFQYRIKPKQSLVGGEEMLNSAKITFDFEEAIKTNTVLNTVKFEGTNEVKYLTIYPNPSQDFVDILIDPAYFAVTEPKIIKQWLVMDRFGRVVSQGAGQMDSKVKLEMTHLDAGNYTIVVYDQDKQKYSGQLIKL